MKASQVHAVIAAGLERPKLLALWQREPERLRGYGVAPDELDLDALSKFAGLTAKVRHNGLRTDLPLTFRLLNVAGLEIEVFGSYAAFRASADARYAATPETRAQDLLTFLEHWLDFERNEHALLWDLIRYELALAQLNKSIPEVSALSTVASRARRTPRAKDVPRVLGNIVLHEMSCNPRSLGAILAGRSPRLERVPLGTFHFCFWRKGATAELHVLELDELGFYLLSFADGKRSTAELSRLIGGGSRPAKGFVNALSELASLGVLTFDTAREQAA